MARRLTSLLRRYGLRLPLVALKRALAPIRSHLAHSAYLRKAGSFDRRHAVDTAGIVGQDALFSDQHDRDQAVRYQPCDETEFMDGIRNLIPDPAPYTFVDLGCGKGKALVMARGYGFRRVIGVELAGDLVAVARSNVQSLEGVMVIQENAVEFRPPDGPLCVFMYNPFHAETMIQVLQALVARKDETLVLYQNPRLHDLFLRSGLKELCRGQGWIAYSLR